MPILRRPNGKIARAANGKIRRGNAGDSCCGCGCCTCETAEPHLNASYLASFPGDWNMSDCDVATFCPDGSETSLTLNTAGLGSCEFGVTGYAIGDLCVSGYSVETLVVGLVPQEDGCSLWKFRIIFFNSDGSAGPIIVYSQRSHSCNDPTGIYDFESSTCAEAVVPATVEIT